MMIIETGHDVWIEVLAGGNFPTTATIDVGHYPSESSKATGLDADDLREIAQTIEDAADQMEADERSHHRTGGNE